MTSTTHKRILSAAAVAVLGTALIGGPAASAGGTPRNARVVLRNISFNPARVTIRRGGTVTWQWRDGTTTHNVTSYGRRRFRSATDRSSGSFKATFSRPGLYRYSCTIHLGMNGAVRVI